jgi:GTP-binding protein
MRAGSDVPLVAVVGRPNVGKSTLFNRIVGGRPAMVEDRPGVTRDRRYAPAEWDGRRFELVDTGGLDPTAELGIITAGIHRQAGRALDEADVIIFVTDGKEGLTSVDREVAQALRKRKQPVLLVVNKIDGPAQEAQAGEMYSLGLGEVHMISANHGRGTGELLDAVLALVPAAPRIESGPDLDADGQPDFFDALPEADDEAPVVDTGPAQIRLAFVGRPNAGKSSLVNRILGEERVLVHDQPGTTTDPVDTPFTFDGHDFVLVDTAGMRRKARVDELTEKISVQMALGQLRQADVAALVIDATIGSSDQDAKIAAEIEKHGTAAVVLVNKIDALGSGKLADKKLRELDEKLKDDLRFMPWAKIRHVSAQTGAGITQALAAAARAAKEHRRRIGTAELNRFFAEVCETHPPPTYRGKPVRIHYLAQPAARPPTFLLWANKPELVHQAYRRYLASQLRERFGFEGTPVRIITRKKAGT